MKDIVCLASYRWHGMSGPPNSMMAVLANANRVLYIEPPMPLLPLGQNFSWKNLYLWKKGIVSEADNLFIFPPPPLLPGKRISRRINKIEQKRLARYVNKKIAEVQFRDILLITYLPHSTDILGQIDCSLSCYMCGDEILGQKYSRDKAIANMDKELIEKVDFTTVVSEELYRRRRVINDRVHVITNGTDYKHFANSKILDEYAEELSKVEGPVVGYMGAIDYRINKEYILGAAQRLRNWTFIFVGPVSINIDELKREKNIVFLGQKKFKELPKYLGRFDVGLIPYYLNEMTTHCSPLKLHEYFSAGIPVVSTQLPAVKQYEGLAYIANSQDEFIKFIDIAYKENNQEMIEKRMEIAESNSWEEKAKELERLIEYYQKRT
jgi:glycosyltransferase involved in cell wall biosynthesis